MLVRGTMVHVNATIRNPTFRTIIDNENDNSPVFHLLQPIDGKYINYPIQ